LEDNIKVDLKELNLFGVGPVVGSCQDDDEFLGFMRGGEFLD
jgi:hypothetical protein